MRNCTWSSQKATTTNRVCKLNKSLYGLKQALRCWNVKFTNCLKNIGIVATNVDPCAFVRVKAKDRTYIVIYVDDGLIVSNSETRISQIIKILSQKFEIKVFDTNLFLGIEIKIDTNGNISLKSTKYINML